MRACQPRDRRLATWTSSRARGRPRAAPPCLSQNRAHALAEVVHEDAVRKSADVLARRAHHSGALEGRFSIKDGRHGPRVFLQTHTIQVELRARARAAMAAGGGGARTCGVAARNPVSTPWQGRTMSDAGPPELCATVITPAAIISTTPIPKCSFHMVCRPTDARPNHRFRSHHLALTTKSTWSPIFSSDANAWRAASAVRKAQATRGRDELLLGAPRRERRPPGSGCRRP